MVIVKTAPRRLDKFCSRFSAAASSPAVGARPNSTKRQGTLCCEARTVDLRPPLDSITATFGLPAVIARSYGTHIYEAATPRPERRTGIMRYCEERTAGFHPGARAAPAPAASRDGGGGCRHAVRVFAPVLTSIAPQAHHRTSFEPKNPGHSSFDRIFRNRGSRGFKSLQLHEMPWSGRWRRAQKSVGFSANPRHRAAPQTPHKDSRYEAPLRMRGAFSLRLHSINSQIASSRSRGSRRRESRHRRLTTSPTRTGSPL